MKRIGLDVGHSENPKQFSREDEIDLIYSQGIIDLIQEDTENGINTNYAAFIIPSFKEIADKNKALMEKIYYANGKGTADGLPRCDVMISIHCNWSSNSNANGYNLYYNQIENAIDKDLAKKSKILAESISIQMIKMGFSFWGKEAIASDNLVAVGNLAVCSYSKMPTVLIELGFLSNVKDSKDLENPEIKNKICRAMFNGIKLYYA